MIQMNLFLQNRKRLTDIENKVIMQGKDLAQSWNRQLPIDYWALIIILMNSSSLTILMFSCPIDPG